MVHHIRVYSVLNFTKKLFFFITPGIIRLSLLDISKDPAKSFLKPKSLLAQVQARNEKEV